MDEEILNRQMPQSMEAEQAVLGSILIDSDCLQEVVGILKPDDFYLRQNREIYEAVYSMFNYSRPVDPVTVLDELKQNGHYEEGITYQYVSQLMSITPTASNAKRYAEIVRDKALLRALVRVSAEISEKAYSGEGGARAILEMAESRIFNLRKGNTGEELEPLRTVLVKLFGTLNELAKNDSEIPGLPTGLRDLDSVIGGLNKSDLILVAARPGMGKTTIALNIAAHVAKTTGKTVAVFSLEMSREQLAMRLVAGESFVDNKKLQTGKLNDEDWAKISTAADALSHTDIRVDDNPMINVAEMNALCRRLSDTLGLVVIDYLQLMTSASGKESENRATAVAEITRALKIMAKDLNVPVMVLSQLNRANADRKDKRPQLSDLRESGAIEQDADQVIFLYRDDYYNENRAEQNVAEIIVRKNRHGETANVKVRWLPQFYTFADSEWKHPE